MRPQNIMPPIPKPDKVSADMSYILSCWRDFTRLTEQENENLKRLRLKPDTPKPLTKDKRRMPIIEEYTGIAFKSQSEAAQILCVSRVTISQHLKGKIKQIKGLYKFRRVQNSVARNEVKCAKVKALWNEKSTKCFCNGMLKPEPLGILRGQNA